MKEINVFQFPRTDDVHGRKKITAMSQSEFQELVHWARVFNPNLHILGIKTRAQCTNS